MLQESIDAYAEICQHAPPNVRIAGGEGSDTVRMAEDFIVNGGAAVIQIDQGRIGGLTSTYQVRQLCAKHGRVFVNHSFKSHLSIAAGESHDSQLHSLLPAVLIFVHASDTWRAAPGATLSVIALHVMATDPDSEVMEFPQGETELSAGLVRNPLQRDHAGLVQVPKDSEGRYLPGLGVEIDLDLVRRLTVPLTIDTGLVHAGGRLYSAADVLAKL